MMANQEPQGELEDLISTLDTIKTDGLKRRGYQEYKNKIVGVARRSLQVDGTCLIIVIQFIKSYKSPCFQRDVLIDVLDKLVCSRDLEQLLIKPFPFNKQNCWDSLATGITTIPDLIANCKCLTKFPQLNHQVFYEHLIRALYVALEHHSSASSQPSDELRYFLLKIIGRIALCGHKRLVWKHLTWRAIQETRSRVRALYVDLVLLTLSSHSVHVPFGIYLESLFMPILSDLKPSKSSGQMIKSILSSSVTTNEQLRYIICDKSIFKSNYNLPKESQAVLLFNIAAYLASLVTVPLIDEDRCDNEDDQPSLLVMTLLEIVRSWTNSTKILIRTYQHTKYIACALVIFLRHAIQYDKKSIVDHAVEIQTTIARAMPTYLNRASQDQRNLATCLGGLVLPKLHDLAIGGRQIAKDGENEELKLNFNVDLNDDLLYLQQLFQQDVDSLFRDLADTTTSSQNDTTECAYPGVAGRDRFDAKRPVADNDRIVSANSQANDKQLQGETKAPIGGGGVSGVTRHLSKGIVVVELDSRLCESEAKVDTDDDDDDDDENLNAEDDLKPYKIDELAQDNSDDDELALGEDATNVPIYLRDCINGLLENNNRLYVRLCLIKAGVLVNDLIEHDDAVAHTTMSRSNFSAASHQLDQLVYGSHIASNRDQHTQPSSLAQHKVSVNDTIRDVGIELARALLFLENQFNIESFDAHRMDCLISLCYAAPGLVGKYLLDEFNGQSRSMRQQLDILHVLVASAHQLSTGSRAKTTIEAPKLKEALCVRASGAKSVNRFAPYASMFFYGIVYRLKADFTDASALVMSQPKSIMSAFRSRQQKDDQELGTAATSCTVDVIIERAIAQESQKKPRPTDVRASSSSVREKEHVEKAEESEKNFLETNSLSDDSILLSRILIAIANIIGFSARQMVTCRLSTDLLDILCAYRCHPDSGVQRAIVNCLRMIKEATPSTYYKEYIERRMTHLFGPWLAKNEANM